MAYSSIPETVAHSHRVMELLTEPITELTKRACSHDRSKVYPPEVDVFDEFTPKLKASTYGSEEYKGFLAGMGEGLRHHYAANRHHPEHFERGVSGMTLVDLIEMLADWKAATERHADGDLRKSLAIQRDRFGLSNQLVEILTNTAVYYGWLGWAPIQSGPDERCGVIGYAPNGDKLVCTERAGHMRPPLAAQNHFDGTQGNMLFWREGDPAEV